ncbi:hypothetical protein [Mangrovicoccus ximenensis]|uniref:hypothetical protein n=1 Tax=Mangrovicoccus ximenensis TaxID=1911570 RepID=UPI0011AE5872|nr:hypothetical protein [Mangrovicoccus ximenensis]
MSKYRKSEDDRRFSATLPRRKNLPPSRDDDEHDPLVWTHRHAAEILVEVDLRTFRDGCGAALIGEIAPHFRALTRGNASKTVRSRKGQLSKFFLFLGRQSQDFGRDITSVTDIESADGESFRRFLLSQAGKSREKITCLNFIFKLLLLARTRISETDPAFDPALVWPTIEADRDISDHMDVEPRAVKMVYTAAKRGMDESTWYHLRGQEALRTGMDPRHAGPSEDDAGSVWRTRANLSVLMRARMQSRIVDGRDLSQADIKRIDTSGAGMDFASLAGEHAPSVADAVAGHTLVSCHTGWTDHVRGICVVDAAFEEWNGWYSDRSAHLSRDQDRRGTVAIFASDGISEAEAGQAAILSLRPKTGRLASSLSLKRSRYHPFSVIKFQLERTRFLRDSLRTRRARILSDSLQAAASSRELAMIERKLRSPWIYYNSKGLGHEAVGVLGVTTWVSGAFRAHIRPCAIDEARHRDDPDLVAATARIKPTDLRDAHASHVFETSGGNIFAVQQALHHKAVSTTRHYLRQQRQIRERFAAWRRMTEALGAEAASGGTVDPTMLRLAATVRNAVTEEDRASLQTFRSRDRLACADPRNPPAELAPGHVPGTLCMVQRCTLCRHASLTLEALEPLALRLAELSELARILPAERFATSSFRREMDTIEIVRDGLGRNRRAAFEAAMGRHREALKTGAAKIFDEFPLSRVAAEIAVEYPAAAGGTANA